MKLILPTTKLFFKECQWSGDHSENNAGLNYVSTTVYIVQCIVIP